MKILTISDVEVNFIYSPTIQERFKSVDLVISCGDLPYYYLEYIISMLNKPLYYVAGNHANAVEQTVGGPHSTPWGAINLHRNVFRCNGLLMAGVEGCLKYNAGKGQYTQGDMWSWVLSLIPALLINKLRFGRYLDVFVTHAPPAGIHDQSDQPHKGINAFRWLDRVFKPRYHFHGHIHIYRSSTVTKTLYEKTQVINTYGFRETIIDIP
jgi:Icc-related predicted phosphoesterase